MFVGTLLKLGGDLTIYGWTAFLRNHLFQGMWNWHKWLSGEVLEFFHWKGKTLRIHPSAAEPEAIRGALKAVQDNDKFRLVYVAGLCRSRADWLVGMNLTVAATKMLANDQLVSVGRVQTPTLALVVDRELDIQKFKPRSFWNLEATVQAGVSTLTLRYAPSEEAKRIWEKKTAEKLVQSLSGKDVALSVKSEESREIPPKLYTLLSFQKDAKRLYKWGGQKSLNVLQRIYEMGLTTYPRADVEFLKTEHKEDALRIASSLLGAGLFDAAKPLAGNLIPRDAIYDSKKIGEDEHHAVAPTIKKPSLKDLENYDDTPKGIRKGDLLKGYEMVARRFLMSLLPDYRYVETLVWFVHEGRPLSAKGEAPLNMEKSWRIFEPKNTALLPSLANGTRAKVLTATSPEGKTTHPSRYTDTSLAEDMSSVAKYVDDPKIKAILKENSGIGTTATRTGIIETLVARGFVAVVNTELVPTPFGMSVIEALPSSVKDPGLTAVWEEALKKIATGGYDPDEFMRRIDVFVEKRLAEMRQSSGAVKIIPDRSAPQSRKRTGSAKPSHRGGKSAASPRGQARPTALATERSPSKGGR